MDSMRNETRTLADPEPVNLFVFQLLSIAFA